MSVLRGNPEERVFGSDFFGRAACEIRSYYETEKAKATVEGEVQSDSLNWIELRYGHLPAFRVASIPKLEHSPLTPGLARRVVATRERF
jgi:hypothetical protein